VITVCLALLALYKRQPMRAAVLQCCCEGTPFLAWNGITRPALTCVRALLVGPGAVAHQTAVAGERAAERRGPLTRRRQWVEEHQINPVLRALLPKDEGKPMERPAEAALRTRMAELLQRVHAHQARACGLSCRDGRVAAV